MILAVCLNPAIDVSYRVPELVVGGSHQLETVHYRAGGKGVNVARVIDQLGSPVTLTGLVGGPSGTALAAELSDTAIMTTLGRIAGHTRQTVSILDRNRATVFREPGPTITGDEWAEFVEQFATLAADATVVVLSGSTPPGVPADGYATLTRLAHATGAQVVVDAEGGQLRAVLSEAPDVVKPNDGEAGDLLGHRIETLQDAVAAGRALCALGATTAVVSRGADGLVAVTPDGCFTGRLTTPVEGNPTGAGDALAAVIALGLHRRVPWPAILARAVAVGGASVAFPVAGGFDSALLLDLETTVIVEEI